VSPHKHCLYCLNRHSFHAAAPRVRPVLNITKTHRPDCAATPGLHHETAASAHDTRSPPPPESREPVSGAPPSRATLAHL
jgi:hypothetical protein